MDLTPQAGHTGSSRLKTMVFGVAGSFILFATYLVVPPLGIFSGILSPLPAGFVRLSSGRTNAMIVVLGTTTLLTALFGLAGAELYLGMCGVTSLLLPELLARGINGSRSLFWTTATNLAVIAAIAGAYCITTGQNIHRYVVTEINSSLSQASTIYEHSGIKGEDLETVKQAMKMMADMVIQLYPAGITITLLIIAGCNLALLRRCASRFSIQLNLGEFNSFKTPDLLIWLLIAAGFAMLAPSPLVSTPALNILVLLVCIYFLQGMAVLSTILSRQTLAGILRIGLYMMLVVQPYLALAIAAMGIFDLWGNFRTPKKQENL